jgi:hypothetical protein
MRTTAQIASRLQEMVRGYNNQLARDALLKAALGIAFSFLVFGVVFWTAWVVGFAVAGYLHLSAWQFATLLTGLFIAVSAWSAWYRVDPLAALPRLAEPHMLVRTLALAAGVPVVSSRHALAGSALFLIGGPANLFQALRFWAARIRADAALIEEASRLLTRCDPQSPALPSRDAAAALLLLRLTLVKVVPSGDAAALALTDKGFALVSTKAGKGERQSRQ